MPALNALRVVKVSYVSEGADRFRADAEAAAASQDKLANSAQNAATVTDSAARRTLSAGPAYDRLRASVDQVFRSQQQLERGTNTLDRALQQGIIDAAGYDRTLAQLNARFGASASAADRTAAAWKNLGAAGEAVSRAMTPTGRLSNLSSDGSVSMRPGAAPAAANSNARRAPRPDELRNLAMQGGDVFASLGSGSSLTQVAFQQGPQIAQVFGPGGASVGGVFKAASESAASLAARVGILGGAIGGATALALLGAAAWISYSSSQKELERSLAGVGRASGATSASINALAPAAAAAGNVSIRSARQMAGEYAATGKIGTEMYVSLISTAKDYAATTGQDLVDANKALAAAFADPTKGAEALNGQLGFLNAKTQETITRLQAQGDRLGAQRVLFTAYKEGLISSAELTTAWGRVTAAVLQPISDMWDKIGRRIDQSVTGGSLEDQIAQAQKAVELARIAQTSRVGAFRSSVSGRDPAAEQKKLDELLDKQRKQQEAATKAGVDARSREVKALVDAYNPMSSQLNKLQDDAKKIAAELKAGVLDPDGKSQRTIDGLIRAAGQLKSDMAAGGAAYADALKGAEREQALVGAAPFGRGIADINNDIEQKKLAALRASMEDNDQGAYEKRLATLEKERQVRLDTARQVQTLEQVQRGGAYSRAPADIQRQILEATARYPAIPPEILAALGEKENAFKLSGPTKVLNAAGQPKTTAWGYGQITIPAETDIRNLPGMSGFDRKDPSQAVMGAAAYLDLRRKWAGGNLMEGLNGYGTGPGYGVDVYRRAGKLGDVSSEGLAKEVDAATQASKNAEDQARISRESYGKNGLALEANSRATERYNAMLARGVPASDALAASVRGLETAAVSAARRMKMDQYGSDAAFEREQLGRTSGDQAAYARARSLAGDTSSTDAQFIIETTRLNDNLRETKALATEAFSGMLTDLRAGTGMMKTLENLTGRLADKLLNKASDSIMSGLFAGLGDAGKTGATGSAGGFMSFVKSALGFADGGFTGAGGKYEPAGIVHRGEYVIDAASVARIGVPSLDAMRRGYADGGYVGGPSWMPAPANTQTQAAANITVINNNGSEVETKDVPDGRGGRRQEIVINEAVAKGISSPQGQSAMNQRRVTRR